MKHGTEPPSGEPAIPQDARPCVWMAAGLVAWKLCDRDFDCERCPLDAALRGGIARPRTPLQQAVVEMEFPERLRFHRLHGWIGRVGEDRFRIGIDAFAAHLLDRLTSVVLPLPDGRVEYGRTACWVADDVELIPLIAPATGTVCETNPLVQEYPGLVATAPYDRGWLYEITDPAGGEPKGTLSADEMRVRTESQLRRLRRRVCASLTPDARVGVTMADGGVRLQDLRRILGASRYHRMITAFLR